MVALVVVVVVVVVVFLVVFLVVEVLRGWLLRLFLAMLKRFDTKLVEYLNVGPFVLFVIVPPVRYLSPKPSSEPVASVLVNLRSCVE
jgi:hypothetical protein